MCFARSSAPVVPPPTPKAATDTPATAGTARRQPFQDTRNKDATVILDSAASLPGSTNLLGLNGKK